MKANFKSSILKVIMCFAKCIHFALNSSEFYLIFYHLVGEEDTESL